MLSIIIPSYKDPYLYKTIDSILEAATGEIEIIPVLDGYLPDKEFTDSRIKPLYLKENVGMRGAINAGVAFSSGEYLMRTDEHCIFGAGFDAIITENMADNWIVTAPRYALDPEKWAVMDGDPVVYEKLLIIEKRGGLKFHGEKWRARTKERKDVMMDETMAMQGSFWIMSRKHWDSVIVELDSKGYGVLYQDSTEMIMKTWQSGGKLMVNKNTWYAHKHASFNRTHNYPGELSRASWAYAIKVWGDYYEQAIRPKWGV